VKTGIRVTMMSLSLAVAVVLAGVALNVSSAVSIAEARAADHAEDADSKECPGPYIAIPMRDSARGTLVWRERHVVEIAASISPVPEFHDCQRFIKRKLFFFKEYEALYAVFAAESLAKLTFAPFNHPPNVAYAAAEVYTSLGKYKRLGIKKGFNCLYLSQANGWEAFMVSVGSANDSTCKFTLSSEQRERAKKLSVHRRAYPNLDLAQIPGVTRWDRDADGKYYITMKCGQGWCDVGLQDPAKRSPALVTDASMPDAERQRRLIRGWYDQQVLAIPSGSNVKPQPVVGTVIPDANLGAAEFVLNTEVHVATIEIGEIAQYKTKLGLKNGKNELYLVRTGLGDNDWTAYVGLPEDPDRKKLKAKRHGHEGENFDIPGTVRWRWLSKDETIWVRCSLGCCQVQEDELGGGTGAGSLAPGRAGPRH
jgi:hypothetical protein